MYDYDDIDLGELTRAECRAKKAYDDAFGDFELAQRARAADPHQGTLDALIKARKTVDRARHRLESAQEDFEDAWQALYAFE